MNPTERLAALGRVLAGEDVRSLSRRYFVANGFDGTLTNIGVVVGASLFGIADGITVVGIGLGAAVGLGTPGVWEIERAEASRERRRIEGTMLTDLAGTQLTRDPRSEQADTDRCTSLLVQPQNGRGSPVHRYSNPYEPPLLDPGRCRSGVPVTIVCSNCGHEHRIPERTFDPEGGTSCPNCGAREYRVRREGIDWHP